MKKFILLMLTVLYGLLITGCKNGLETATNSEDFVTVTLNLNKNENARNISPCDVIDNSKVVLTEVEFICKEDEEKNVVFDEEIEEEFVVKTGNYIVKVTGEYEVSSENGETKKFTVAGTTKSVNIDRDMNISVLISLKKEETGGFEFDFVIPERDLNVDMDEFDEYGGYILKLKSIKDGTILEYEGEFTDSMIYTFECDSIESGFYELSIYTWTEYDETYESLIPLNFKSEIIEITDGLITNAVFYLKHSEDISLYATTGSSKGNGLFPEFRANINDIFAIADCYPSQVFITVKVDKNNPDEEIIFDAAKTKSSNNMNIESEDFTYYFRDNTFETQGDNVSIFIDNSNGLKNPTGMNIKMENYSCYRELNATIRNGAFVNVDVTEPEFKESSPDRFMDGRININFSKIEDFLGYYNNHNKIAVIKTNNEIGSEMFGSCFYVSVDYGKLEDAEIVYKQIKVEDGYLYEVYLEEAH